ncbi:ATP-binding protein [Sphingobacterium sp. BN32]|uniref:ATP-binding protein n=1 Tax=Sphingobacterium sp. BN32 TaxID=3058432 RepID=UPI00265D4AEB|nr:ATP-binding protein [Sphingobacterium sp. BN32]WKK57181.1 ATP-binding protein [Sphingobacterium sp. BN32]
MIIDAKKCEDEKIHLLGLIQPIGFLVIIDREQRILAHSDIPATALCVYKTTEIVGKRVPDVIADEWQELNLQLDSALKLIEKQNTLRFSEEIVLGETAFYISLYGVNNLFHLEFELKPNYKSAQNLSFNSHLNTLSRSTETLWQELSRIVSELLPYDRIMVYKFNEDSSGIVVAETVADEKLERYLGFNYPEFDIPKQARELYSKNHLRFIVDATADPTTLKTAENREFDLQQVAIRSLSPIHLQYLQNAGFKSSLSISIMVMGKLWGLVCCQHPEALHVDLQQRNLALTATHYAAARFQHLKNEERLEYIEDALNLEIKIKETILLKNNVYQQLKVYSSDLNEFMKSEGFALLQDNDIYTYGLTPPRLQIAKFVEALRKHRPSLYLSNHHHADSLAGVDISFKDFPGIAYLPIIGPAGFQLIWFRQEIETIKKWAGKPEKNYSFDEKSNSTVPSPRTSFDVWMEQVKGTSAKWTFRESYFIQRLRDLLQETLLKKASEISNLNEQLIEMNNALDTYSYTISHDLKNPLSAIKLSGEFLRSKDNVPDQMRKRMTTNILEGVETIVNMLDKIHEFTKANVFNYEPELINTDKFIDEIVTHSKDRFSTERTTVFCKNLLPVYGEKTLIYQLFLNIIGNAIKYSAKSEQPHVEIQSYVENNGVMYIITDNGIGMEKEELDSIYEIFKRMSNSAGFDGSGVGMAIVKRIVDKLGIKISIQSNVGVGTEVYLYFPNH